ncbi:MULTISPECIES: ribonuclease P protein component [unclassified Corynebacterium]|uniref:ribonuclease P protein component n=1 Tax=unclassified Corynebacterium TaxID=2624378 RepID=UPI0029C9C833|nr:MULTISPECIES: ribonuclease P protein component [unclassified Corynebacterium]WPF66160.1 ribonuclease P protein component [Corynebacterium sp. 22KM0430]WPF68652.1 ribonuclease P protein component [Corynebacterium sp. 21KM1197]
MLPAQHKLTAPSQFRLTMSRGRRAGSRTVVLHVWEGEPDAELSHVGGPRFGLVVSKAVGNAVARHRVSRRLRHICLSLAPEMSPYVQVVVRALPAAGEASSVMLERDIRKAWGKIARADVR